MPVQSDGAKDCVDCCSDFFRISSVYYRQNSADPVRSSNPVPPQEVRIVQTLLEPTL